MEGSKSALIRKLTLIMIVTYVSFAPMSYFSVLLRNVGFDSRQLGLWNSLIGLTAMISLPFWGVFADKIRSPKKVWLITMVGYALIFGLLPLAGSLFPQTAIPLYVLILLYGLVKDPSHSMQDAWYIGMLTPIGISFASVRMWGSLSNGVLSIFSGFIVEKTGINPFFWSVPVLMIPVIFFSLRFKDAGSDANNAAERPARVKIKPWILFKNYRFVTSLFMTLALSIYMTMTNSFFPFILESANVDPERYGLLSGYSLLIQVGSMFVITRFLKKVPDHKILIFAGIVAVIENIVYGLSTNFFMLFVASTLWGIEISVFATVLPSYTQGLVDPKYAATAQSIKSSTSMLLMVIGNLIGGNLIAAYGIRSYNFGIAAFQGLLVLLFALSIPIGKRLKL